MNEIYLGQDGAYAVRGVGRAAQFYFGKDVSQLGLAESVDLQLAAEAAVRSGLTRLERGAHALLDRGRRRARVGRGVLTPPGAARAGGAAASRQAPGALEHPKGTLKRAVASGPPLGFAPLVESPDLGPVSADAHLAPPAVVLAAQVHEQPPAVLVGAGLQLDQL